ncbi:unnamed protein product [Fraxinus pennsylvanica]|uniref:NADH:flavin oxidoreductase/NADH oxidase N-terminal domain-containing protein n=1 Tax=Fraxinus pennsylvanica TaxID=56036 RepID=A0AAD2E7E5_9LAMI|nr:unnamed protein product [Fraxinus pennsylvanica]
MLLRIAQFDKQETKSCPLPTRKTCKQGLLLLQGVYNMDNGNEVIGRDGGDLLVFGRLFLANPDLPGRFELNSVPISMTEVRFKRTILLLVTQTTHSLKTNSRNQIHIKSWSSIK